MAESLALVNVLFVAPDKQLTLFFVPPELCGTDLGYAPFNRSNEANRTTDVIADEQTLMVAERLVRHIFLLTSRSRDYFAHVHDEVADIEKKVGVCTTELVNWPCRNKDRLDLLPHGGLQPRSYRLHTPIAVMHAGFATDLPARF